jgi:outer membrane protein OmpU
MNQRLLLGSTALVGAGVLFTSPVFAQDAEVGGLEVSLGGYTEFLVEGATDETLSDAESDRGYFFNMDTEIHIQAEGTTDGGLTYGSQVELEAGALPMEADEMNLYFSGGFGRLELGRQDGVVDTMVLDATIIAAGTGGVDGDTDNLLTAGNIADVGDATKITYYTPRIAGFQLGGSFTPDSGDGVDAPLTGDNDGDPTDGVGDLETVAQGGVNWEGEFGGLETGLFGVGTWGSEETTDDDVRAWAGGGLIGFGGLDFAASYGHSDFDNGNEIDFLLVGARFAFGPAQVGFHYERDSIDGDPFGVGEEIDDNNTYVASADVGLMPGVVLKGDVSYSDSDPGALDPGDETWAGVLAVQLSY